MFFVCCRQPSEVVEASPAKSGPKTPQDANISNKYLYDTNHEQIIGIDNSGSKYAPTRKIQVSTIPYEERLERAIQEEEDARRKRCVTVTERVVS